MPVETSPIATRMTALRNPKGTAIASRREMEKIIYDFYSDLFDSHVHLPPHHQREDGHVIPEVLPSEIRHAIISVKNRTAPGPDRIRPEHLKNLSPVLINTLARLFHVTCRNAKFLNSGRPTRPCCFVKREIHMTSSIIAQSAYCPTSTSSLQEWSLIGLKKTWVKDSHASKQDFEKDSARLTTFTLFRNSSRYHESTSNFTTGISPFYKNIIIDVKKGVRQGDTISPKIFAVTLENAMRKLEWDDMGMKVDGRISQAERMLTEFDETCGCIGLELNIQKTMFMRNGWVSDAPFTLNGTNISECTSYVYLSRELNMMNDLTTELGRRRRAAWGAYKSIEDVVKKTRNTLLRAHLFNTIVLPALT
ncbi:hypothetical protein RB195_024419 [Necator americanus]|uniref:Reverse transcriptase domain-containing protein n=1 Tax=Necator americanus TaxID=51031 RepID=A0ABR1EN29_NECAM